MKKQKILNLPLLTLIVSLKILFILVWKETYKNIRPEQRPSRNPSPPLPLLSLTLLLQDNYEARQERLQLYVLVPRRRSPSPSMGRRDEGTN